jgi:proline dehydrogenase
MKALTFLARRFVAGETAADAIAVGRKLAARGIRATFDLLGENVLDADAARRATRACQDLLRAIPPDVERNISIKLSMMGLEVDEGLALQLAGEVAKTAAEVGGFVRIDMEGSALTQRTIDVFRALRRDHENVGIVLQAYLRRTATDVDGAIAHGDRVRLCKGAYREPAEIAFTDPDEIRRQYRERAHALLAAGKRPAIATHDETLIQDVIAFAREMNIAPTRFEFQMLYGLRRARWDELVRAGYGMRVYVPYGTYWMPYFYRRLRERKENVLFVLRHLVGR